MTDAEMEELQRQLAATRAEYAEEEREAAEEEARDYAIGKYELYLSKDEQRVVHELAERMHLGPNAVLHGWIRAGIERETDTSGELGEALEAAKRDLERVERLARRAS